MSTFIYCEGCNALLDRYLDDGPDVDRCGLCDSCAPSADGNEHARFADLTHHLLADMTRRAVAAEDAMREAVKVLGAGDDEDSDSPGNMAFAILMSALSKAGA